MTVPPAIPHHAVDRPRLRALLDEGINSPLTLVVAPAGSGKTVLLAQWASRFGQESIAWLELTPAEDDAVRLARRLVDELITLDAEFAFLDAPLGTAGGGLGDPLIEALAARFAEVPRKIIVVLDDLHRITNQEVIGDLWRLVDMLPPNVHFIFSSRVDLRLGWSRHRLRHGLVEIRRSQLAFGDDAAAGLLERISGAPIDPAVTAAVVRRTEGWAAGVQLAGLRLRAHPKEADLVELLDEGDRLAIDYLSEEVLAAQTPQRRQALLELSVLDELSAGLVEAVADVPDGADFLERLELESLFVVPVYGAPGRFRFHHLFRDLLRIRLRATAPQAEPQLLLAAADWHRAHGAFGDAVQCLLSAKEWSAAIDLVLSHGRAVYERGETTTVARWLSLLPDAVLRERPEAVVLRGILEGMSGRAAVAEDLLRSVLDREDVPVGTQLIARAYVSTAVQFRAPADRYLRDGHEMLAAATSAGDPPTPDLLQITSLPLMKTIATISIGRAHLFRGRLAEARQWLGQALAMEAATYAPYRIHLLGSLAICEALSGHLHAARGYSDEALDLAREFSLLTHPAPADAYIGVALVAIQRGRAESGALALHEGWVRAASNNRRQLQWIAHVASRLIDPQGTDIAAIAPEGTPPEMVRDVLRGIEARRLRFAGRPVEGRTAVEGWPFAAFEAVAGALSSGDAAAARAMIDSVRLPHAAEPVQSVELNILRSWLLHLEGRRAASREHLRAALRDAMPEHLLHPFLRAGSLVLDLIAALPGDATAFRAELVARNQAPSPRVEGLIEPLTPRELELLAYLPTRLTNRDLAARCFVSVNTVKTHIGHIYRKLGVPGRNAAVDRARELGLLQELDQYTVG